jgi:hypothetical protein
MYFQARRPMADFDLLFEAQSFTDAEEYARSCSMEDEPIHITTMDRKTYYKLVREKEQSQSPCESLF